MKFTRRGFLGLVAGALFAPGPCDEDISVLNKIDPSVLRLLENRMIEAHQRMAAAIARDIYFNGQKSISISTFA